MQTSARVAVANGAGVVVRRGSLVGVLVPDTAGDEITTFVAAIERVAMDTDPFSGASTLLAGLGPGVSGAAVVGIGDAVSVAVLGDLDVHATSPGAELHIHGRNADTPVVRSIGEPVSQIVVGAAGDAAGQPWLDLDAGAVPGGGVSIHLHTAETGAVPAPATTAPAEPEQPPAPPAEPADDFEAISFVSLDLDDAGGAPLPVESPPVDDPEPAPAPVAAGEVEVQGLRCRRGHFNHPHAANCVWCGLAMVQDSYILLPGPRPPLGILVVNETATYSLERGYVIGRNPSLDERVQRDELRPLPLQDPDRSVSRVHAEVVLDGWDVKILDRGSANGTWLLPPEAREWQAVPTDSPVAIPPGGHVQVGPHRISFHSHHVR